MANQIPNTSTPGQVLTSVGNGTNATTWAVASGGGGSLPTGTYNGQIAWYNASTGDWVTSAAYVPPSSNSYLRWNGSEWEPDNGELLGDVTGTFSTSVVTAIQGNEVYPGTPSANDVLVWVSTGSSSGYWLAQPLTLPSGNGYSWNETSGSAAAQTITTTKTQITTSGGEIEIVVSGYTQYQVTVTGGQEAVASGTSLISVEVAQVPYTAVTGGTLVGVCIPSTVSGAYSNFSVTYTITLPTTGSYTIAPYIQNSASTNPKYAYFTFSVLGVR